MIPTITELNNTIEEMRKIYPFKDDSAKITFRDDLICRQKDTVVIHTEENGTKITLERKISFKEV